MYRTRLLLGPKPEITLAFCDFDFARALINATHHFMAVHAKKTKIVANLNIPHHLTCC